MTPGPSDRVEEATVFVPITLADWRRLVADTVLTGPLPAYGITPGLQEWGEFGPDDSEDAMFAAQTIAGVAALALDEADRTARRVVVAVPARGFAPDTDSALGGGELPGVRLADVSAVFSDDPSVSVAEVRAAAAGLAVAEAWDHPMVAAFSDAHDLGWYTVAEASDW